VVFPRFNPAGDALHLFRMHPTVGEAPYWCRTLDHT
jgi:hypothetical protein